MPDLDIESIERRFAVAKELRCGGAGLSHEELLYLVTRARDAERYERAIEVARGELHDNLSAEALAIADEAIDAILKGDHA